MQMRKMPAKDKKEKKEKPKQTVVPGTRAPPVKKMVPRAQKVAAARLM